MPDVFEASPSRVRGRRLAAPPLPIGDCAKGSIFGCNEHKTVPKAMFYFSLTFSKNKVMKRTKTQDTASSWSF